MAANPWDVLNAQNENKVIPPPPPNSTGINNFVQHTLPNAATGLFQGVAAPFEKVAASGVRAIQATPQLFSGDIQGANQTMAKPINIPGLGQIPTLAGSSNVQNLGTAAQVASFGVPAAPGAEALGAIGQGAVMGGLQGGGGAAQNPNASGGQIAGGAALGAGVGAALGGISKLVTDHPIFQPKPNPIMNPADISPQQGLAAATAEREQAAEQGVQAVQDMTQQVGEFKSGLGTQFAQGAADLEKANPELRLNLSNEQMSALNDLKENKSFALPKYLENNANQIDNGTGKFGNIKLNAKAQAEIDAGAKATQTSLTPTQTQDLITQLNKSTFRESSSGLQVDQQRIATTNEIKNAAKSAFGKDWENIYSNYAKGTQAVEKLGNIVNLDNTASPADMNKSLTELLKLGKTPEGKILLKNAVEDFKQQSGIDLTDPVKAVHQILDKQIALEDAQGTANEATKAAKAKAAKGGFLKQVTAGATNPQYLGKRLVEGGAIAIFAYPMFRKLSKLIYGQ